MIDLVPHHCETTTLGAALCLYAESDADVGFEFVHADGEHLVLSARELEREAARWASAFSALGVRQTDRVALSIERVDQFIYAFWGCQLIGAIPTTLPPFEKSARIDQQRDQLRGIIAVAKPRLLVIGSQLVEVDALEVGAPVVAAVAVAAHASDDFPVVRVAPDAIALIQFTSGSTRTPKGCALSHHAIIRNAEAILERGDGCPGDVNVHWVPLSHDMGLMGAVVVPVIGRHRSVVMHPKRFMMRPLAWVEALAAHRNVHSSVPNFALRMVARRAARLALSADALTSVKTIICGAEPIDPVDVRAFYDALRPHGLAPETFHASYGMAEATVMVSSSPQGLKTVAARPRGGADIETAIAAREYVSVGTPVRGARIRIVDGDRHSVSEGVAGDVELMSDSLMSGYFDDPEATAGKIVGGWLKTGDIGFIEGGDLFIAGRRTDMIIIAGKNVFPADIEPAIADRLGIDARKVAAFSAEGRHGTEDLIVLVEHQGADAQPDMGAAISRLCDDLCGVAARDVLFRKSGTIPRTTSGKTRRADLRDLYRRAAL